MSLPTLWALELSTAARSLLLELQRSLPPSKAGVFPSVGHASSTLRDALISGINELARKAGLDELDPVHEREPEGTHVSPVVPRRNSEPPPPR